MSHDETIEQAAKTMHAEFCCPCDPQGCDWIYTREARYAVLLADAGLLARPLPDRDEIEDTISNALREQFNTYGDVADAVLELLKGQDE